jgi:flagellar basal-body rod protein FlgC
MTMDNLFKTMDISASGLRAEWVRMRVVANNVANAETTETPEGGPYRKRHVVFSTMLDELSGVSVAGIVPSASPPKLVFNPGHPDANAEGFVAMPDVKVPLEMIDLLTASRAYEANLAAMRRFRQICEEALKLLR